MENKLEQLLNSLIKAGWKPRGYKNCIRLNADGGYIISMEDKNRSIELDKSIRDLTAKESGLWKFVCKNGMIKNPNIERYWKNYFELDHIEYYPSDFQYWVLESSLKDESELEDFLLSNIKVDAND